MRDHVLETQLAPTINNLGYELLGIERLTQGRFRTLVRIYIDHPNGITITDCERVSQQLSSVLDVTDPIASQYTLEISSPGLDRPLFHLEQYPRFCGSRVRVRLNKTLEQRRKFLGILKQVDLEQQQITLVCDEKEYNIAYTLIDHAQLDPTEEDIQALLKARTDALN
ncbi:ribosome maturation factor RimP [Thioflexithrix psekupsensis]|uniref:Ribosome maturation factor RimP n=1 Tax=Thioflexithrix psekupsensis TaxID=1570016 RepID=A0A251XAB1_9GAMM|nr:ribosome maturation factor RimP [Thioflexithrix psekupsensis]OUD15309.1 ribosome maturation factor RimP [Thioflexithrix psekupsensis]